MSTIKVNKIENTSTTDGGVSIDVDGHVTIDGLQMPTAGPLSNRSLIINGAMTVAQRATSVTGQSGSTYYTVDRISHSETTATGYTFDQEQSTDAPTGFSYSFKNTTATALTDTTDSEIRAARYKIEGQDLQHLKYGTADAQTITLSFWVKTNVQGTYIVRFVNNDDTTARRFAGQYIIENDETGLWQYRTITIAGDTNTAIANSNENEFDIFFITDAGSNRTGGTANQWDDSTSAAASPGQTAFAGRTVSDYWQITGLQLEVGSKATPFEHESYAQTLLKCMRYFQIIDGTSAGGALVIGNGSTRSSNNSHIQIPLGIALRDKPAASVTNTVRIIQGGNSATGSANSTTVGGVSPSVHTDNTNFNVTFNYNGNIGYSIAANTGGISMQLNTPGTFRLDSEL